MRDYRLLNREEINVLESNGCWAEDWTRVQVAQDFRPYNFHRVVFYGDIQLGSFEKQVEVSKGFVKHSGINDATLRNVSVGNDCLIEKVGNFINNYTIGDDCYISNISTIETTEGATYGAGSTISVLNEMGDGNVTLFRELNSQLAAFMVKHEHDKALRHALHQLIDDEVRVSTPERGVIGNNVKIINTKEITNTVIKGDCEISGAARLSECTVMSSKDASVYIGTGVICENSIICDGCSILNSVKMQDCFVGEACQITNGFTAEASLFFANSFMANGEACAAFCGPFSASHHKSSLLIGGQFSFYNAGSNTNFSNHAYKMGPMHYGTLALQEENEETALAVSEEAETETAVEAETETIQEAEAETETIEEAEAETEMIGEAETETIAEAETEMIWEAEAETEMVAEAETETEMIPEEETETVLEEETETTQEAETETEEIPEEETEELRETETETETEEEAEERSGKSGRMARIIRFLWSTAPMRGFLRIRRLRPRS